MEILKCGNTVLPSPVSITSGDEIIWSSGTGRGDNGKMFGDVIAEKKDVSIQWEFLSEDEVSLLDQKLIAGFFPFSFRDGGKMLEITSYRGTMSKQHLGYIGDGIYYYRSVSVQIIQQ